MYLNHSRMLVINGSLASWSEPTYTLVQKTRILFFLDAVHIYMCVHHQTKPVFGLCVSYLESFVCSLCSPTSGIPSLLACESNE